MITDLVESGCDVNAENACYSFDYLAYRDYYRNFRSYRPYRPSYRGCKMNPLLHMAVGIKNADFLKALKKVHLLHMYVGSFSSKKKERSKFISGHLKSLLFLGEKGGGNSLTFWLKELKQY